LKKILKTLFVLKNQQVVWQYGYSLIGNSLVQLSEQALRCDLFYPKTILYQDKDTCAIRLGFGHLNEEEMKS
jgi:hypothetical protein